MPTLVKEILPEGSFLASSPQGRTAQTFSPARLKAVADTANAMLAAGLRIPAPFDHNKDAVPLEINAKPKSAFNNAGYWSHFYVGPNDKGVPTIHGLAEVPGSDKEPDSPYYKAMNTTKEVSVSIRPSYKDGIGRVWEDALMHVALVNHAVVPDQKGFEQVPDGATVINMSMADSDDNNIAIIGQLRSALLECCEVVIPESSDNNTFLRDLLVAVSQKKPSSTKGEVIEPVPIYMSVGDNMLSQVQAEALVKAKVSNPTTNAPYTMEDLGFKTAPAPSSVDMSTLTAQLAKKDELLAQSAQAIKAFVSKIQADTSRIIGKRIADLVAAGVIPQAFADTNLIPKTGFEMSILPNGQFADHPLEVTLSALEAIAPMRTPAEPEYNFSGTVEIPALGTTDPVAEVPAADMDAHIKEMCSFIPQ